MSQPTITAVAGPPGSGKTTWIRQQLAAETAPVLYFSPGSGNVPIDQTCIAAGFPQIKTLTDGEESLLAKHLANGVSAYIELGFHLQLTTLENLLQSFPSRRIGVVPPEIKDTEWHKWADVIVEGIAVSGEADKLSIWRSPTKGQVLDPASLDMFWYQEMTQGAYGKVHRAKGIFDIADGRSFYFDFAAAFQETAHEELPLPRWLEGRPQRFSGIEIVGENLDETALGQTLEDCCLSETIMLNYQQQVKQSLSLGEETA
ncbi:MAG: GTP-binding protein [Microcoleus sp. PH2017_10_PVI_O_A]|uniref:GTP-binding protein n=1 Tax=unclassified Microcoleus TaxID=2642155 RepID=UPI001D4D736A|nr:MULTISPECIES: GTP-binding protein [unclassified Microcoleus]TAE84988.1 MAG: GTP-binding protein [Oscillatoriales cyanobacterium]MCC3404316.1 GTP-binding protein [Microcoleus sp. PH2017_10_PVI_O_A]MCC3458405.1 GTP-binding protein [Microcoleus sp. PH2017_11_PCY_U_A]MCC3476743.1 GTP-binding protein [Microcoleus sp. PH2017_12_PCY_D_A]MCC3526882.1 GTP-binding protein [Microcoleus sp. PH2017_21_RUC_O_A]